MPSKRAPSFAFALVAVMGLGSAACAHQGQQPMGTLTVQKLDNPEDAPEEAKTVQVEYAFRDDLIAKDFDRTFNDKVKKKGFEADTVTQAHAHFDITGAKITGTVTYVKKKLGYSIVEADLVAEGHYDADVQVDVDVKAKGDSRKATDADWQSTSVGGKPLEIVRNMMPANIPIAGPLFLHTHFDLTAACAMDVQGQMHATTGVGVKGDVHLAAKYKKAGFDKDDGTKTKFKFEAKAPNFELAPKPYLTMRGGQQKLQGRCSLQPTAVLLLEHSVGAKIAVEPYVDLSAERPDTRSPFKLDAQAGVSLNAATDVEVFGRHIGKPKEFTLAEITLTKPGDAMGDVPQRTFTAPPADAPQAAPADNRNMLAAGLSGDTPKPVGAGMGFHIHLGKKKKTQH